MPAVLVRNLSVETHRALKERAARNGKSTEAEIRVILDEAVQHEPKVAFGTELRNIALRYGVSFDDYERDPRPSDPAVFE